LARIEGKSSFVYNDLRGATHAWEALRGRLGGLVNRSTRRAFFATGRSGISLRHPFITNLDQENAMTKLLSIIIAATFAAASVSVMAQDKKADAKKPSAAECKKDPKMKGCEPAKK